MCKPNCADFPTTPKNKKNATKSAITMSNDRRLTELVKEKGAKVKTVKKSILPAKKKTKKIPTASPQSPIRLTTIAFKADLLA